MFAPAIILTNNFGMGYQFVHIETYARKADASGRSVDWVLAEARRDPEAALHVKSPQPPELIHGVSLEELKSLHDELAGSAKIVLKNGKSRSIRKDQQTLLTVVASYPIPTHELNENPEGHESLKHWEKGTIAWLQSLYGEIGGAKLDHGSGGIVLLRAA